MAGTTNDITLYIIPTLQSSLTNAGVVLANAQKAETGLNAISPLLNKLKNLNSGVITAEIEKVKYEISKTINLTTYIGSKLLDGNFRKSFAIGFDKEKDIITLSLSNPYIGKVIKLQTAVKPSDIDNAIEALQTNKAHVHAIQSRIEFIQQHINAQIDVHKNFARDHYLSPRAPQLEVDLYNKHANIYKTKMAESACVVIQSILAKIKSLGATGSSVEINMLLEEITSVVKTTTFDNNPLLDGHYSIKRLLVIPDASISTGLNIANVDDAVRNVDAAIATINNKLGIIKSLQTTLNTDKAEIQADINSYFDSGVAPCDPSINANCLVQAQMNDNL